MGFLDKFFGKGNAEAKIEPARQRGNAPLAHTIAGDSVPLGKQLGSTSLRKGMWVRYEGRTGIATAIVPEQIGGITLVNVDIVDDKTGHTTMSVTAPIGALRQATHDEIPEVRRPHEHVSIAKGYLR